LFRRFVVELDEPGGGVKPGDFGVIETGKQNFLDFALLEEVVNGSPFKACPFLLAVVRAHHHDNEVATLVIKLRQVNPEIAPGEFSLVILVVEDRCFSEMLRENGGDLGDKVSLFPRKGERDGEAFGTHLNSHRPFFGI
jgi:hypothetical protein